MGEVQSALCTALCGVPRRYSISIKTCDTNARNSMAQNSHTHGSQEPITSMFTAEDMTIGAAGSLVSIPNYTAFHAYIP
jgi:hypothetical protein